MDKAGRCRTSTRDRHPSANAEGTDSCDKAGRHAGLGLEGTTFDPSANAEGTDSCDKAGRHSDLGSRAPRSTHPLTRRVLTRAADFRCISRLCDNGQYRPTRLKSSDSDVSATRVSTLRVSGRAERGGLDSKSVKGPPCRTSQYPPR